MSENISLEILQQDLGNVDLLPSVPKNGTIARFKVTGARQEVSKNTGAQMLVFDLLLDEPVAAQGKDELVQPGAFKKQYNIVLTKTDRNGNDRTPMVMRDMAAFRLACTGQKSGAFMPLEQYIGCTPLGKVKTVPDDQYGYSCDVARFIEPAPGATTATAQLD